MLSLDTIRTALRWGVHPADLPGAEVITSSQRTGSDGNPRIAGVYRVGKFIVKEHVAAVRTTSWWNSENEKGDYSVPREEFKKLGVRAARQTVVGGWVIQPDYGDPIVYSRDYNTYRRFLDTPAYQEYEQVGGRYDFHAGNVAVDRRGRFVAFDW